LKLRRQRGKYRLTEQILEIQCLSNDKSQEIQNMLYITESVLFMCKQTFKAKCVIDTVGTYSLTY
jgi:hypothetical protein